MFCLHAGNLNDDLRDRAKKLKDMVIEFEVEENRELNKGYDEFRILYIILMFYTNYRHRISTISHLFFFSRLCKKYEDITNTVRGTPETTEELVSLKQYLKNTRDVTIHKLIDEVDEATYRLSFLLDYATLTCMCSEPLLTK